MLKAKSMRINIVGGGPSGLYFAYLMKKTWPDYRISVIEQNAHDDTFGFGVVLSGRALSFLSDAAKSVVETLLTQRQTWSDQHIVLNCERVVIDGSSYSAISRLVLLNQLQKMCSDLGVAIAPRARDAEIARPVPSPFPRTREILELRRRHAELSTALQAACLFSTSDAPDDLICVDLGGRRVIKKKTTQ